MLIVMMISLKFEYVMVLDVRIEVGWEGFTCSISKC